MMVHDDSIDQIRIADMRSHEHIPAATLTRVASLKLPDCATLLKIGVPTKSYTACTGLQRPWKMTLQQVFRAPCVYTDIWMRASHVR